MIVTDRAGLAVARDALQGTVALVPTMGALHEGHVANIRAAAVRADHVIVSVFVNPLQFGPREDFDSYPRQLERDAHLCDAEGVSLIFAPSRKVMYPREPVVRMEPGPVGEILEGASRPGFFGGVLTVVAKLFHLTRPDVVCFGEKDFQQLAVVRQMVSDLDFGIKVVGVPTVREADGLALSSRNVYLSEAERRAALAIPRALAAAAEDSDPLRTATTILDKSGKVEVDYVALTDPNLGPAPESGPARLLIAARVGTTRLIDNAPVHLGER